MPSGGHVSYGAESMTSPKPVFESRMTFEQYLAFEERSMCRHEFIDGRIYAMTGGTRGHHRASFNIAMRFHLSTGGRGCEVFHNDFKIVTPRGNAYYPDVVLACAEPITNEARFVSDPCLIVEVLSPSTRRTDEGEKRWAYQEIPSLEAYWIVEATWRGVERHWRDTTGAWCVESLHGAGTILVPCLEAAVTLDQMYEGVDVPGEPPRARLRRVREPDGDDTSDDAPEDVPEYAD